MKFKNIIFAVTFMLLVGSFFTLHVAKAASTYSGEFISFSYENSVPKSMTILDSNGKRVRHNLASNVSYSMNGRGTNASSFHKGMTITFVKDGNVVTNLKGVENTLADDLSTTNYQISGIVTKIDPNGMYISVKPDNAAEQSYYINKNTKFFKNSSIADLSMLYEGDRVKLKFPNATVSTITELEIMYTGTLIENIYKATLKSADAYRNTITVSNAQAFENWMFGTSETTSLSSFTFTNETSIYAGNQAITKDALKNYSGKEFYFATITKFGKEIVQKIVILLDNERTYYDDLKSVNTTYNLFSLKNFGNMYYHNGSILIRNGRLIEPTSLTSYGTAYLITDGTTKSSYAQVVNVTNDGFTAPNLANHDLYFGELSLVDTDSYLLQIDDAVKLTNNYWKAADDEVLAFSNGTSARLNYNSQVIKLIPNMDLWEYETYYGYFYVKNGHVQAMHILDPAQEKTSKVLTGTVSAVNGSDPTTINIKNVSQWDNGGWIEGSAVENINLAQTLILKNGKVISANQIKKSNRVVLLTTTSLDTHVLLVNE